MVRSGTLVLFRTQMHKHIECARCYDGCPGSDVDSGIINRRKQQQSRVREEERKRLKRSTQRGPRSQGGRSVYGGVYAGESVYGVRAQSRQITRRTSQPATDTWTAQRGQWS